MTALPDWDIVSDAELAAAAAAGDRRALAGIYDRYADRLHDFCIGMVRDRDTAADCVQDVFCTAATQLAQLRDPDKLRPWLYSIARNEALRRIRDRRRERVSDELPETASGEAGPDTVAARTELAELINQASGGISERDRTVLELSYRHGLDLAELAEALGVSYDNAKKSVQRLRETIETSLGALLVARRARNNPTGCPELAAVLDGWDETFNILIRKRIARHIESCPTCEQERRELVNPVALLGAAPVFIPAPAWLREHTLNQIQLGPTTASAPSGSTPSGPDTGAAGPATSDTASAHPATPPSPPGDSGPEPGAGHLAGRPSEDVGPAGAPAAAPDTTHTAPDEDSASAEEHDHVDKADSRRARRLTLLGALIVAAVITTVGLTVAWLYYPSTTITPTDLNKTVPPPANRTSMATNPAATPPPVSNGPTSPPGAGQGITTNPVGTAPPTSGGPTAPPTAGGVITTAPVVTPRPHPIAPIAPLPAAPPTTPPPTSAPPTSAPPTSAPPTSRSPKPLRPGPGTKCYVCTVAPNPIQ